ncbi:hypothetical protein LCD46_11160 [Enterobacter ludwigii]|uniref:hypothetical protein n=1 Tax=unclassified Enterobacter TaxID=2608935 RepID=UPI001ABE822F|nr:hypothetical protein [Enterobacter ludwigii]UOY72827.1 hypothetical protein LCD46_11160 [Enterobacter ludwigii]
MVMNYAPGSEKNPKLVEQKRADNENNLEWLLRAFNALKGKEPLAQSYILLLGGTDTLSWRIRAGQSQLRFDMLPSYWSTSALLCANAENVDKSKVLHIPLFQPQGGFFATERNGVVESPVSIFKDSEHWKNIALIAFPKAQEDVLNSLPHFQRGRNYIDALEHILRWLAFAWGVARTPTPINDGIGLPTACMLESLYSGAGMDLTPGLETRASTPEAIWATASRWYKHFENNKLKMPKGRFCTPDSYNINDGHKKPSGRANKSTED